uniref:Uncharacterized protein n=1 Tax=Cacopsylla melanoneura TaxID=428564 RepID=A0A8D9ALI7_9HEMI
MAPFNIFFVALAALLFVAQGNAWKVDLFRDWSHKGGHIQMAAGGCANVPDDFNDQASAINTFSGCVRLYENHGCTGRSIRVDPGTGSHDNLAYAGDFNDKTSSVGPC